jgi:dihydrofolate synthase/folylpolyglutamate synthase
MFHRIGAAAYKANLDNIHALTDHLNHPENKITTIHIAGTNGKGSVSNMISSIFQEAGYKTGLFTSPHLKDFRERIRIDGKMIPENEIVRFVEENKIAFEKISPSFFEWTTALAFEYFANEKNGGCNN